MLLRKSVAAVAVALAPLGLGACGTDPVAKPAAHTLNPADFTARVDNPWFPLRPGTTFRYRGTKDGKRAVDVYSVTHEQKRIQGVPNVVVKDRLYLDGKLGETTQDWYTQDRQGNVWYFGEATKSIEGGKVSTEGSWQAGVGGARPGIFMPADPRVGDHFRQEYFKGHAEDQFQVLRVSPRALLTKEWTRLEPAVLDHKRYVRGVGEVQEASVKGPKERLDLVSVSH